MKTIVTLKGQFRIITGLISPLLVMNVKSGFTVMFNNGNHYLHQISTGKEYGHIQRFSVTIKG